MWDYSYDRSAEMKPIIAHMKELKHDYYNVFDRLKRVIGEEDFKVLQNTRKLLSMLDNPYRVLGLQNFGCPRCKKTFYVYEEDLQDIEMCVTLKNIQNPACPFCGSRTSGLV